jgi:transposase
VSLQPELDYVVPEQTARVAKASFPNGALCLTIYDHLGTIFRDHDFRDLFPRRGQPAQAPFRLALVTILQFIEGLSDRAAAQAVRARIDWKYLLCLELDDPGFDSSVLCEFRRRLLESSAEHKLFDTVLNLLVERKLVKARGRQRTDSTHVLAAIRSLNRLERAVETMRCALNAISSVLPEWVRANAPAEWVKRYGPRADESRLPESEHKRQEFAEQVAADGNQLLDALWSGAAPPWLRQIPAVETLRIVWVQNFHLVDGLSRRRETKDRPQTRELINSPYDTEARLAIKRQTTWVGYKVHLTESCDDDGPHVITHVETGAAHAPDNDEVPDIHQALSAVELLPATHLVDGAYVEAKSLVESRTKYGVELVGPAQKNNKWQSQQGVGFDNSCFTVDWEHERAICPAGKTSDTWKPLVDRRGNSVINIAFAKSDCSSCASLRQCTSSKIQRRMINIKPREYYEALRDARARENGEEYRKLYALRAGVEGTISQGVRACGLRRARYIVFAKTRLQHLATAAAMNLERVADWFAGTPLERTRCSAFARVMAPRAA